MCTFDALQLEAILSEFCKNVWLKNVIVGLPGNEKFHNMIHFFHITNTTYRQTFNYENLCSM